MVSACQPGRPKAGGQVIASVGTETLTLEYARAAIPSFMMKEDSVGAIRNFTEGWVKKQLMAQEASRLGLPENISVAEKLASARDEVLQKELRNFVLNQGDTTEISRQEAVNYYERNKRHFVLNERHVKFRHIITPDLVSSRQAKADLMAGITFDKVVETHALDARETLSNANKFFPISLAVKEYGPMNELLEIHLTSMRSQSFVRRRICQSLQIHRMELVFAIM